MSEGIINFKTSRLKLDRYDFYIDWIENELILYLFQNMKKFEKLS